MSGGWSAKWPEKEGFFWVYWYPRPSQPLLPAMRPPFREVAAGRVAGREMAVEANFGFARVRKSPGTYGKRFTYFVEGIFLLEEEICALWKPVSLPRVPHPAQLWGLA